jgi:NADH-quinone oxidoreductase subunit E
MAGPFDEQQQAQFDAELLKILARYPDVHKAAAMLPALWLVQRLLGFIPVSALELVASRLGVPPGRAREVATFYVMYYTEPKGRHVLDVCTNISCSLCGAENALAYLEAKLGIKAGQTTTDKKIHLREAECLASCGTGPMLQVDGGEYVENLTPKKLDELVARLRRD